jgi:cell wall-associated NlpC family hydrolase
MSDLTTGETTPSPCSLSHLSDPERVEVRGASRRAIALFTQGAATVTLAGPTRTFSDPAGTARVRHGVWVRMLPRPFDGDVDWTWLGSALAANADRRPDVLAIALQYVKGAPSLFAGELRIAGDACYGPLRRDGSRDEGSDFNDYLGIAWTYPDGEVDEPEARQERCLDCSGFVRMVFGYRRAFPHAGYGISIPLSLRPVRDRSALPRRAFEMLRGGPGRIIIRNDGMQVVDLSKVRIGDLVFFDAETDDGTRIDHVGIYVGLDRRARHRFLSSREGANGPTMSDIRGASVLDGLGFYARAFRAVRRL